MDDLFPGAATATATATSTSILAPHDGVTEGAVGERAPKDPDASVISELDRQTTPKLIARAVKFADLELGNLGVRGIQDLTHLPCNLVPADILRTLQPDLGGIPRSLAGGKVLKSAQVRVRVATLRDGDRFMGRIPRSPLRNSVPPRRDPIRIRSGRRRGGAEYPSLCG